MYYDTDESDFARGEWLHESGGMNIAHICTYADASRGSLRGGGSIGRAQQDGTGKKARGGPLVGPGGMPSLHTTALRCWQAININACMYVTDA